MLAVARELPAPPGAPIESLDGSALALPFAAAEFDVVLCQLGLQFFPDRPAALAEMRRVLKPAGRLALNVFAPIERNPAANALSEALDRHVHPDASHAKRAEHVLGDPVADYVRIQLAATPRPGPG